MSLRGRIGQAHPCHLLRRRPLAPRGEVPAQTRVPPDPQGQDGRKRLQNPGGGVPVRALQSPREGDRHEGAKGAPEPRGRG
eukprot:15435128-Alexandrium_andersonii.AAC.1